MGKPSVSLLGRGGGWEKLDIFQDAIQIRMSSFNTCFWHYSGVAWYLYPDNSKSLPSSQKHFLLLVLFDLQKSVHLKASLPVGISVK